MSQKLRTLDLFAGIGGFSLGLERTGGFETVAFCEIEPYPQKVLAKHWPGVPIYEDVRQLTAERLATDGIGVDVITGGFPCQDISAAGKQAGISDGTRSGLWSECARLLGELQPRYAIFENVTALLSGDNGRWFEQVLWDISQVGYDAEWHCIPVSELGGWHNRDRVWITCYPSEELREGCSEEQVLRERRLPIKLRRVFEEYPGRSNLPESRFHRTNNGVPNQLDRLESLGNAVVPQIPELIGRAILESEVRA